jgi:hypothetical protein
MARLSKWVETEWGPGLRAGITFGRENGHRLSISLVKPCGTFDIGVCLCWTFNSVSVNAGLLSLFLQWQQPYRPAILVGEPETPEAEAQREEDERCCLLMEDIEFAVADRSSGELERILALVKESVAADGQPE